MGAWTTGGSIFPPKPWASRFVLRRGSVTSQSAGSGADRRASPKYIATCTYDDERRGWKAFLPRCPLQEILVGKESIGDEYDKKRGGFQYACGSYLHALSMFRNTHRPLPWRGFCLLFTFSSLLVRTAIGNRGWGGPRMRNAKRGATLWHRSVFAR